MTLIYFILILGITVSVHEFGHFIFAKMFKVHVYEFSIGMGKKLFSFNRANDETTYSIRLLPIGGYVKLAGEEIEDDENIADDRKLSNKSLLQKFLIFVAGATFNFIFAFLLLIIIGLFYGSTSNEPILGNLEESYPTYQAGLRDGDRIIEINDKTIKTFEDVKLVFSLNAGQTFNIKVIDTNNNEKEVVVSPDIIVEDDIEYYLYGISKEYILEYGFISSIKYGVTESYAIFRSMFQILGGLFTGDVGLENMSGPIGIYTVVGETSKAGFENMLYLLVLIGINIGIVNLLPIPAFDGGRIVFLVMEKIKGSPINPKTENIIHAIFFILLMMLMIYITFNDILRLF